MAQEKTFENKIKKYLNNKGAFWVKHFANAFTKAGIPDLLCCINGHFVAIEVKADGGKPSELQLFNIDKIRKAGGFAFLVYPSGFAKLKQFIEGLYKDEYTHEIDYLMK